MVIASNLTAAAQKPFTLEELLGGGKNFWQLQPENKYTTWWGETALETTPEEVKELVSGKTLVTVAQINEWVGNQVARNGHNLIFPYPEKSLVLVQSAKERMLVDFEQKKVEWKQGIPQQAQHQDWHAGSRNLAYTVQGNLFVLTSEDKS